MEQFWTIFWSAIGILTTGLITWLTTTIVNWLNSKIKDKKLATFATTLFNIVMSVVQQVNQTFVDTMKKQGKFTEDAAKEAFDKCKAIVMSRLTPELIGYIQDNFGDVNAYIATMIESCLYQLKNR